MRRFETVLDRAPVAPAVGLPLRWQPLATALLGERPDVRLRTDPTSRAALRAAGKVAATRGNVIHLAEAPGASGQTAAVLAHELAHVAHPSPRTRFFDDDRPSAEERVAEQVADIIRRSPVLPRPSSGPAPPAVAGRPAAEAHRTPPPAAIIRRSPAAPRPAYREESSSVSAADLVARLTGAATAATAATTAATTAAAAATGAAATIRRSTDDGVIRRRRTAPRLGGHRTTTATPSAPPQQQATPPVAQPQSAPQSAQKSWPLLEGTVDSSGVRDLMDWIVEQLEDRIAHELERRGGRYRGEF